MGSPDTIITGIFSKWNLTSLLEHKFLRYVRQKPPRRTSGTGIAENSVPHWSVPIASAALASWNTSFATDTECSFMT